MVDLKLADAKEIQAKSRFRPYKGKLLLGERHEIDKKSLSFPRVFQGIPQPPEKLYVIGDPTALQEGLSVVGARHATPYGLAVAHRFATRAAAKGVVIISGGAKGCDSAAHEAALRVKGRTVAFLGGGCDELYPASNQTLFQRIIKGGGAIVSEYEWKYPPLKHTFRARNRLIAGLARATLIVEAGLPSGTFSTADEALAANKEVLVVPGSINSITSRGANRLLYQGATPIVDDESFDDVLFSLFGMLKQEEIPSSSHSRLREIEGPKSRKIIYQALCAQTMSLDEMIEYLRVCEIFSKIEVDSIRSTLMYDLVELQKNGFIARYPDGRFGWTGSR